MKSLMGVKQLDGKSAFFVNDKLSDEDYNISMLTATNRYILTEFYAKMLNDDVKFSCYYTYGLSLDQESRSYDGGGETIYANQVFLDINNIGVKDGRTFNSEDYSNSKKVAMVGYDLGKRYPCGSKIDILNVEYEVVGVMKKNASYNGFDGIMLDTSLESSVIIPLKNDHYQKAIVNELDMMMPRTIVFASKEKVKELNSILSKLDGLKYELDDRGQVLKEGIKFRAGEFLGVLIINIVLFIMVFAIYFVCWIKLFKKNQKELFIRRTCGATIRRLSFDWAIITFIVFMIPCIVFFFSGSKIICGIIVSAVYSLLLSCFVNLYLSRTNKLNSQE